MADIYQVKLRRVGDRRDWADIPLHDEWVWPLTPQEAKEWAGRLANHPAIVEARYNVSGSLQGHYVPGPEAARLAHREAAESAEPWRMGLWAGG